MGRVGDEMREKVFRANRELAESGLVMGTFGNVSAVDRDAGVMVIKPSGVPYRELSPGHMVAVSLASGEVVDSGLRPSSDTPTHLGSTGPSPAAGSSTRTRSTPRPSPRPGCPCGAWARPTPITSGATSP